jgi:ABC-type histidine transport system ATPase subunit
MIDTLCYVRSASQGRRELLTCIFFLNKPLQKKISLEDDVFDKLTGFRVAQAGIRDKRKHQEQHVQKYDIDRC